MISTDVWKIVRRHLRRVLDVERVVVNKGSHGISRKPKEELDSACNVIEAYSVQDKRFTFLEIFGSTTAHTLHAKGRMYQALRKGGAGLHAEEGICEYLKKNKDCTQGAGESVKDRRTTEYCMQR